MKTTNHITRLRGAIESATDWLCDAERGTDQYERGTELRKAHKTITSAMWQACVVQGLLGFGADTKPEEVTKRVHELLAAAQLVATIADMTAIGNITGFSIVSPGVTLKTAARKLEHVYRESLEATQDA